MCYPGCGMVHIKDPLLLLKRVFHEVVAVGFLSHNLSGHLTCVIINRKCVF